MKPKYWQRWRIDGRVGTAILVGYLTLGLQSTPNYMNRNLLLHKSRGEDRGEGR